MFVISAVVDWVGFPYFFQNSPIPTSLPEPLTASEVAAKKSMTKARYVNFSFLPSLEEEFSVQVDLLQEAKMICSLEKS